MGIFGLLAPSWAGRKAIIAAFAIGAFRVKLPDVAQRGARIAARLAAGSGGRVSGGCLLQAITRRVAVFVGERRARAVCRHEGAESEEHHRTRPRRRQEDTTAYC